jgi:hypothetical protein
VLFLYSCYISAGHYHWQCLAVENTQKLVYIFIYIICHFQFWYGNHHHHSTANNRDLHATTISYQSFLSAPVFRISSIAGGCGWYRSKMESEIDLGRFVVSVCPSNAFIIFTSHNSWSEVYGISINSRINKIKIIFNFLRIVDYLSLIEIVLFLNSITIINFMYFLFNEILKKSQQKI